MGASQGQLREIVQARANEAEERFEGYRVHLAIATLDILAAERRHAVAQFNIVVNVTERCERLGDLLELKTEGEEAQ